MVYISVQNDPSKTPSFWGIEVPENAAFAASSSSGSMQGSWIFDGQCV